MAKRGLVEVWVWPYSRLVSPCQSASKPLGIAIMSPCLNSATLFFVHIYIVYSSLCDDPSRKSQNLIFISIVWSFLKGLKIRSDVSLLDASSLPRCSFEKYLWKWKFVSFGEISEIRSGAMCMLDLFPHSVCRRRRDRRGGRRPSIPAGAGHEPGVRHRRHRRRGGFVQGDIQYLTPYGNFIDWRATVATSLRSTRNSPTPPHGLSSLPTAQLSITRYPWHRHAIVFCCLITPAG